MDDADFLRALAKDPQDETLRAAYADWLEEQSDLRGEYLRLEQQVAVVAEGDPRAPAIENRLRTLLPAIDAHWLAKVGLRFDLILFTHPLPRWVRAVENVFSFFSGRRACVSMFSIRSKVLWHEADTLRNCLRGMLLSGDLDFPYLRMGILPAGSVVADCTIDLGKIMAHSPITVTEG